MKVAKVAVAITTDDGTPVEQGFAEPSPNGGWIFTTTAKAPAGALRITVDATDLAGHRAEQTATP